MRSDLSLIISRWKQSWQSQDGTRDNEDYEQETAFAAEGDDEDDMSLASSSIASNKVSHRAAGENMGGLSGKPNHALQSHAAFLNGRPSHLLYFWEIADAHQLLASSLQRLRRSTGTTDASSAPSTLSTARTSVSSSGGSRRCLFAIDNDDEREERVLVPLVHSIKDLADC